MTEHNAGGISPTSNEATFTPELTSLSKLIDLHLFSIFPTNRLEKPPFTLHPGIPEQRIYPGERGKTWVLWATEGEENSCLKLSCCVGKLSSVCIS